jgi:hypothetical protein
MGTELPTKVMLGKMLVLMQITFLNNVRKVSTLVLSRTSCLFFLFSRFLCFLVAEINTKKLSTQSEACIFLFCSTASNSRVLSCDQK